MISPHVARALVALLLFAPSLALSQQPNPREEKLKQDRKRVEAQGVWIYNDLPSAFDLAKESGKPLLVVLRCVPCEQCVKLDDDLLTQDPVVRPLLDKFVCARQVSTNGLDLSIFQFDTDQSWAVFLLNADGTIYGRFGTRSHRTEWTGDVSIEGLGEAMLGALELHAAYPQNRAQLAGKRGAPLEVESPEEFPSLEGQYSAHLAATNVVPSCIHCHQIGEARRKYYRDLGKPIPEKLLYPYPHPKTIGLTLDPAERATVTEVADGSAAQRAGFQAGDRIRTLESQPLLSMADIQWVLDGADPDGQTLTAEVERGGKPLTLNLQLEPGWRRRGDISWRASSWELRRMVTGGLWLETLPPQGRAELGLPDDGMALRVKHVGQYGDHAAAKRAGFQVGDVIVGYDGRSDLLREGDLLFHGATSRAAGEKIAVNVRRGARELTLEIPVQK